MADHPPTNLTSNILYVLNEDGEPVVEYDPLAWARWTEEHWATDRIVAHTIVGDVRVSTIFLGTNMNWTDRGDPVLYETMIFGDDRYVDCQWRYTDRARAALDHEMIVERLRNGEEP